MLLEDNDNAYSTRGKADNKAKQAKPPSGDPVGKPIAQNRLIRTQQRASGGLLKQRLKGRGPVTGPDELRRAVKDEWDKITLEEINNAVASMPDRIGELL